MKKIPTLFERLYDENGKVIGITDVVKPGFEWVLAGEGQATIKADGSCCAILNGELYKRYDAKKGKTPPEGAIPCQPEPDPVTGHWPHWVKCDAGNPADRWYIEAFNMFRDSYNLVIPGTYEAIGQHFNGNPYNLPFDTLVKHGDFVLPFFPRDFKGIKNALSHADIEGVVFWKDGEAQCKIKRTDFGFMWPTPLAYYKEEEI